MSTNKTNIFSFNKNATISNWLVVDDFVMGGKSVGTFNINNNGFGEFSGVVSLENNGGFSSLRYRFKEINVKGFTNVVLRLRGDGRNYQFRIKDNINNSHAYIYSFSTVKNEWQRIVIPLQEMYPAFRGKKLEMQNFPGNKVAQIAFLINNKIAENFKLEIDTINFE
jgi:hypothetical protein